MSEVQKASSSSTNFNNFIKLNRDLLDCYASISPIQYKLMNPIQQKDFCFRERVQIEEQLIKGKIST